MSRKVLLVTILPLFFSAFPAFGNEIPPLDSSVPSAPNAHVSFSCVGKGSLEGASGLKVSMHEAEVAASFPLVEQKHWMLGMGFAGAWNQVRFRDSRHGADTRTEDLYAMALPVGLRWIVSEEWTFFLNMTPSLATDFREVTEEDCYVSFSGLGVYQASPAVSLVLGVVGDREFGDDLVFPVGGMIWNLSRELQVSLLLPWPRLTYAPCPGLAFFCDAHPAGNKWSIGGDDEAEGKFKLERWRLSAGIEARLCASFWLQIAGGADTACSYKIKEEGARVLDAKADDSFFLRAGLLYRCK